jgi:spermidine/putrescine ABC transporter ATP-binding subunit
MSAVNLERIRKSYNGVAAIDDVSLHIERGKFLTLLGPSGCGKSTTLRIVAGLITPDSGVVEIGERNVVGVPVWRRNVGMMFQSLALFPHMTVGENVAFGLRMRKVPRDEQTKSVRHAMETVRLGSHFEDRYPHQMSGGQQQRVALARALVFQPDVLLLDEPFGALDRKLREAMQAEVFELTRRIEITSLFVTHDQEEALILSDYIAVMNHGRIVQFGTPNDIYERPTTRFVADFMGAANIFRVKVVDCDRQSAKVDSEGLIFVINVNRSMSPGEEIEVALRPEHVALDDSATGKPEYFAHGKIASAIYHGAISSYEVTLDGSTHKLFVRERNPANSTGSRLGVGAEVFARWSPSAVHVLNY